MGWTGFVGNNLWDWLNLVALPVAVALIPVARDLRREWSSRTHGDHRGGARRGRRARPRRLSGELALDRLHRKHPLGLAHLLLLPLLLPTVIVPSLTPGAKARMVPKAPVGESEAVASEAPLEGGDVTPA